MATKAKYFTVNVDPSKVMFTSINTSKDGYNSARMAVKVNDNEYMSISYEWEGSKIPGFAMDLMAFVKNNSMETSKAVDKYREDFNNFSERNGW